MKPFLLFVFSFQLLIVEAFDGDGMPPIGAIVGPIFAIVSIIFILSLLHYCYKRYKQKEQQRHSVRYANNSNSRTQVEFNGDARAPPPSYFQTEPQRLPNHQTLVTIDQPPSYSTHMSLYHTNASGQPMISGNIMRGLDNPAFLNRSVSSFSDLPNMADVLLTSSRTSIPAAIMAEGNHKKINKMSDSARGDSIESKATSSSSQFAYVNPQFSTLFAEDEQQKPKDLLNERFESITDSESDLPTDMGGRWLDSIKNQQPAMKQNAQKTKVAQANKLHNSTTSTAKSTANKPPSLDKSTHRPQKKRDHKTKMESSDSGAEVSSNPRGSVDRGHVVNETRLSKISSDSGLGDASTVKKSKQNPRLKWDAVDSRNNKLNRSLSTDV